MNGLPILSRTEIQNYFTEELNSYITVSSKKAFLTRSRKDAEAYHDDLVKAYNGCGWLHGERVSIVDIQDQVTELSVINQLYSKL